MCTCYATLRLLRTKESYEENAHYIRCNNSTLGCLGRSPCLHRAGVCADQGQRGCHRRLLRWAVCRRLQVFHALRQVQELHLNAAPTKNAVRQANAKLKLNKDKLLLKNIHIPHAKNAVWKPEKKIEAVTTYLALGSLKQTAAVTGVSHSLIKQWHGQAWWKDLENEIVASRRVASANKLSKIVDKSLDVIDDRLDNGDFAYNSKSGEVYRKPVTLRDATTAANALMQRAAIIEKMNKDEQVVEATQTIQEQLVSLAAEFAKMNKRNNSGAQDVAFKELDNAIHEEREEGLQDGSEEIHLEAGSGEEEDGAERSASGNGEERIGA